jgi:hypothetical protein
MNARNDPGDEQRQRFQPGGRVVLVRTTDPSGQAWCRASAAP